MVDYSSLPDLERRLNNSFQSQLSQLAARVQSDLGGLRTEIHGVSQAVESCESRLSKLKSRFRELESSLDGCTQLIEALTAVLDSVTQHLQQIASQAKSESQREGTQRKQVNNTLEELQASQQQLADIVRNGYTAAEAQMLQIQGQDDAFRHRLTKAAAEFQQLLQTIDRAVRAQIGGIERDVRQLRGDEEDYLNQAVDNLQAAVDEHLKLTASLSGLEGSSARLAERIDDLAQQHASRSAEGARRQAVAHNAAGLRLLACGQFAAAATAFRAAVAISPDCMAPRLNLAIAVWRNGDLPEARSLAADVQQEFAEDQRVQRLAGILHLLGGQTTDALEAFEACLDTDNDPLVSCGLGLACWQAGWPTKARQYFLRAAADNHDLATVMRNSPPELCGVLDHTTPVTGLLSPLVQPGL